MGPLGFDGEDGEMGSQGPQGSVGATGPTLAAGGRLTLESGVAVSTTDQAAKTSIFYTPYANDLVPIYDGAAWISATFTEITLALDSDSGHTGYQQSGKNFDLFVVNDAGTLRLGTGPAWTSDTARGTGAGTTELERKNGLWTNKVSMTLRFGSSAGNTITVAANQGTYVGTMRASANGQTTWELGGAADGGNPGFLYLWNAYHRVLASIDVKDTTDSWTYNSTTKHSWNSSNSNRVSYIVGADDEGIAVNAFLQGVSSVNRVPVVSIGVDSTSVASGLFGFPTFAVSSSVTGTALYCGRPGLGHHFIQMLENSSGSDNAVTLRGDNGGALMQSGMTFQGMF